jgi:hypothetical protein
MSARPGFASAQALAESSIAVKNATGNLVMKATLTGPAAAEGLSAGADDTDTGADESAGDAPLLPLPQPAVASASAPPTDTRIFRLLMVNSLG